MDHITYDQFVAKRHSIKIGDVITFRIDRPSQSLYLILDKKPATGGWTYLFSLLSLIHPSYTKPVQTGISNSSLVILTDGDIARFRLNNLITATQYKVIQNARQ